MTADEGKLLVSIGRIGQTTCRTPTSYRLKGIEVVFDVT